MKGLIGRKIGMTQVYDDEHCVVPVTVIQAGPCSIISLKNKSKDSYSAVQIGFGERKLKNISKPVKGNIAKGGYNEIGPELIREIRTEDEPNLTIGDKLTVEMFSQGDFVDVSGTTKGKSFQGVVKRYRFGGGRASHGGDWERRGGSIGMCEKPGKVYRGRKMPGHMGNVTRTVQNLQVIKVNTEESILAVKGAIPGPNGGFVTIKQSKKK